eukprot:TRINITY_DN55722_c0_g1_i1.p1 TRINITY_DN55722_c0_g1~~TRINITY_DN55722_c0_g1_i1.p1  ORF type:complete len:254 (+),score=47.39 TRINITY_DN55722_c0_g1_i1:81-842(+)
MEAAQVERNTAKVVAIVERTATANEAHNIVHPSDDDRAFFDCVDVPGLSFGDYVRQLAVLKRDDVWPSALIFASRYCAKADVPFNVHAMHRLMLTAYTVACKLYYDLHGLSRPAAFYGSVGLQDLHRMERAFLQLIDWDLYISAEEYAAVADNLAQHEENARCAMNAPGDPYPLIADAVHRPGGHARTMLALRMSASTLPSPKSPTAFTPTTPSTPHVPGRKPNGRSERFAVHGAASKSQRASKHTEKALNRR